MIEINTQSSIKIDNIYFDPFKIEKEYKDAKVIFITHPHYDHFDLDSIKKIEKDDTLFVIPDDQSIKDKFNNRNVLVVEPNKEYQVNNIKFKTMPAYNINKPYHKKEYNWVGYIIYLDKSYYVMGDTDNIKEALEVTCAHLFIPIGGTYTMDYEEAAKLTNIIRPKIVTPIHYGSIIGNKEDGEEFKKLINSETKVEIIL